VRDELKAFISGFHQVIPYHDLQAFEPEELDLIIGGSPFVDVEDWRVNTLYSGDLNESHQLIVWFW
jgi:hypothetical protein